MNERAGIDERVRALRAVPLFARVGDDSLRGILEMSTEFEVAAGHLLIEGGHAGAGLFVIEEGSVVVGTGPRKIELGPGEFFGELALLTKRAVHATRVVAKTPVRGLAISRAEFQKMLASEPELSLAMLKTLAERLSTSTSV